MEDPEAVHDMRKVCPLDITAYAKEALAAIEAGSSMLAERLVGPPDFEPLCDHVKKKGVSAICRGLASGAWRRCLVDTGADAHGRLRGSE